MSGDVRWVRCYCGEREVVTRRPPEDDYLAVCSKPCWEKRINAGIISPWAGGRERIVIKINGTSLNSAGLPAQD